MIAESACALFPDFPYATTFRAEGLPPNDTFNVLIAIYKSSGNRSFVQGSSGPSSDANGNWDAGNAALESGPYKVGTLFFHDLDDSHTYNQGDEKLANLIFSIDQPCTGAEGHPK